MHLRTTIAAFLVALSLGGYYTAFELEVDDGSMAESGEPLVPLKVELVTRVQIVQRDGETLAFGRDLKEPAKWLISKPIKARADLQQINRMYQVLHRERVLTSWKASEIAKASFGLDKPELVITLSDGKATHILRIGAADPGGRRRYMSRDDDPRVHLVDASVHDVFSIGADELQDRRLFRMTNLFERSRGLVFERKEQTWTIAFRDERWLLDPGGERVGMQVPQMIENFLLCRWDATRPTVSAKAATTIAIDIGDADPLKVSVSALDDERYYWVWGPGDEVQYRIGRVHLDDLLRGPDAVRSREILHGRTGATHIVRVEVWREGGKALEPIPALRKGATNLLEAEDEKVLPHFSTARTHRLLTLLDKRGIAKVLVSEAKPSDLKSFGFAPASAVVKIHKRWWRHSRQWDAWCAIHVGKDVGGLTAIRIEGWPEGKGKFRPGIYGVDARLGLHLREGRLAFRDSRLFHGLDVTKAAKSLKFYEGGAKEPRVAVIRDSGARWRTSKGEDATAAIVDLLQIFDRAFKVVAFDPPGSAPKSVGLDAPDYRIVIELDGKTVELRTKHHGPPRRGVTSMGLAGEPFGQHRDAGDTGATNLIRQYVNKFGK